MGNINTASVAKALTYSICLSGIFLLGILAHIKASPFVSELQASTHRKGVMKAERAQNPCIGCHRIYHRATYAALGEQKFFNAYPTFKPETPWHTRPATPGVSKGLTSTEAQWRVYHERRPIPGSVGEHDTTLEVYVFEDGTVLIFAPYGIKKKIAAL